MLTVSDQNICILDYVSIQLLWNTLKLLIIVFYFIIIQTCRYETELLLRKENEEKVHQLEQQISFGEELSQQRQAELQERLAAANTAILTLESKIYAAHQVDQEKTLSNMLSTVRDTAEMELTKYKRDVEETYSTNVSSQLEV